MKIMQLNFWKFNKIIYYHCDLFSKWRTFQLQSGALFNW